MELKNQLEILKIINDAGDSEKFKEQYLFLKERFTSESETKQINDFVDKMLKESMEVSTRNIKEIRLRYHLIMNKEIIPVSYIAKNYFKKSKEWLYQRINGNLINGKSARFSESEIDTFYFALHDMSKKIGAIK